MGFLDDLANTIKEAMEEAKAQAEGRKPATGTPKGPVQAHPYDVMKMQQRMKQKAEEQQVQQAAAPAPAPSRQPKRERERPKQSEPAKVVHQVSANRDRLYRLMHQPQTLREMFLIKELLDKPLALRRR